MTELKTGTTESNNENVGATHNVSDVIQDERAYLGLSKEKDVTGLAISGGGIRSASFGLGVMQALVANDQLEKVDYMSTVSGGGYLGAALTWALHQGKGKAGTKKDNFPLGNKNKSAGQDADRRKETPDFDNNGLLDFIRQHSSYLMPTSGLGLFSFAGVVLRSILLSLSVYFGVFLVSMILILAGLNFFSLSFERIFVIISIWAFVFFLVKCILYSVATYWDGERLNNYMFFINGQRFIGYLLTISIASLLIGVIPDVVRLADKVMGSVMAASTSTIFGVLTGIWQYVKAQRNDKSSGPVSDVVIYLAAFALVYGLLVLAYIGAGHFFEGCEQTLVWPYFITLLLVTFILGFFVNLNLIGPHRIWRNRLMEAFMPDEEAIKDNKWMPAKKADSAFMEKMCDEHNKKPYHIINTNVILGNSEQVKFKGRGGDNFILSPRHCGSEATGWKKTSEFQKKGGRGITLATAMATSAAALNPDAGVSGAGPTRSVIVSTLLSMLNLRLGYWTGNPAKNNWPVPPNFFVPGLSAEILRLGFKETDSRILLSDGGHFENLAMYELIRRKVDLIILSDGGADGIFNFDDLANAVEKVRVDFGAKIIFGGRGKKKAEDEKNNAKENVPDVKEVYALNDILFDADGRNAFQKKYEIAKRGFAIAKIIYNDGTEGTLVYLKLAMIDDLSTDVYSYKGVNPTFPHQSTADQFFDEKQFEAYRELGYTVAWKMMESVEGKEIFS